MFEFYKYNQYNTINIHSSKRNILMFISFITIIILILFSYYYKVYYYLDTKLIVKCEDECFYYLYANTTDLNDITGTKALKLNKNNYPYKIISISDIMYDEYTLNNYQLVEISFNLPQKYQINNLVLDVQLLIKEERLIKVLKETIWKE